MFSTRLMSNSGLLWPSRIMRTVSTINSSLATDFPADGSKMVTVTIDNASIHLTKQSKSLWMNLDIELLRLPQYCPHLVPWELVFRMVKRILSHQVKYKKVDFSKVEGQKAIVNALEKLGTEKALNMWKSVIKISKAIIVETKCWCQINIEFLQLRVFSSIQIEIRSSVKTDF